MVDKWVELNLTREGDAAVTRGNNGMADGERVNALIDLVQCNSIAAIAADDDAVFDYYLLKLTSDGADTLKDNATHDYGMAYPCGTVVLKGHFFLRDNIIERTYKLDNKLAIMHANIIRAICGEVQQIK